MSGNSRYLILVNPIARRGAESILAAIRELAPVDVEFDVEYTSTTHCAAGSLAGRARNCDAVIAIGGDGTVAEAATASEGVDVPLGIIPAGSTNVIARSFGIPKDPRAAAALILEQPRTRRIDVGVCNGRRFLHMGGAGFDSRMFEATSRRLKQRLGWLAYLQGASKTILAPPVQFTIDVDGTIIECASPLVLVANGAAIVSPTLTVLPGIRYDDGMLDVVIFTGTRFNEIARMVGRMATRSLERSPFMIHIQGRSIEVRADPSIAIQLDGDIIDRTPASFTIMPGALELIVPE